MLFGFNKKVPIVFKLSAKTTCLEKSWLLTYGPKTTRPGFFKLEYLTKKKLGIQLLDLTRGP